MLKDQTIMLSPFPKLPSCVPPPLAIREVILILDVPKAPAVQNSNEGGNRIIFLRRMSWSSLPLPVNGVDWHAIGEDVRGKFRRSPDNSTRTVVEPMPGGLAPELFLTCVATNRYEVRKHMDDSGLIINPSVVKLIYECKKQFPGDKIISNAAVFEFRSTM